MLQVTSCSYCSHKTNTALPQQIMYTIILDHNACRVILMSIYISSIMLSSSIFQLKLYATKLKPNPEIHSTYQADAFNMDTLDHLYTDITFFNTRHPDLLYCFQMLFPFLTIVLLVVHGCTSYSSTKIHKSIVSLVTILSSSTKMFSVILITTGQI